MSAPLEPFHVKVTWSPETAFDALDRRCRTLAQLRADLRTFSARFDKGEPQAVEVLGQVRFEESKDGEPVRGFTYAFSTTSTSYISGALRSILDSFLKARQLSEEALQPPHSP